MAMRNDVARDWTLFLESAKQDFIQLNFKAGRRFAFRPPRTILYDNVCNHLPLMVRSSLRREQELQLDTEYNFYKLRLLHEIGHALLGHRDYGLDLERVKMECAAWEKARELCRKYKVEFDEEFMETELDTYRDWLHQRSKCPICGLTRYQTGDGVYHCPGQDIGID